MRKPLSVVKEIDDALESVSRVIGFKDIKTSFKLSLIKQSTSSYMKAYMKSYDSLFLSVKEDKIEGLVETVDYVIVGIQKIYNVAVKIDNFVNVTKQLESLLEEEVSISNHRFVLSEFETDIIDKSGDQSVHKRVSLVTPAFLTAMAPFIDDELTKAA